MTDTQLGRYHLIRVLGQGSMGIVYEARDPHLDRSVAVKTARTRDLAPDQAATYERRFLTEARSAARLRHPSIVSVFDAGKDGDVTYLVMELVDGVNLKHCLNNGVRFTPTAAAHTLWPSAHSSRLSAISPCVSSTARGAPSRSTWRDSTTLSVKPNAPNHKNSNNKVPASIPSVVLK